jgi:hypothetical protein
MITFTFGLVELGRLMLVKQTATHATREGATREGARVAVRPTADRDEVIDRVNQELALLSIQDATIEMEPELIEDAEPGSEVTIRVRVGIDSVSWVPGFFNFTANEIVAESSMRRESTN